MMKFKPDLKTKQVLKRFSELIEAIGDQFFYTAMGGIAVDGHAGRLTRNHPDVDMLVFRNDLKAVEKVLDQLGYPHERFGHPKEPGFEYKIRTNDPDWTFTFQIIDQKPGQKFEISFYRDPHMVYPLSFIKPPVWLTLEEVHFPAVSKKFLTKLKENEVSFFKKLKKENPEKYRLKRKDKHAQCLHDIRLLRE